MKGLIEAKTQSMAYDSNSPLWQFYIKPISML